MRAIAARRFHPVGCARFWTWALVGLVLALAFLSLGTLGVLPIVVGAGFLARRRPVNGFGLLSGIGLMLLVVAYIQRSGQSYDPVHWLVAGLVFLVAGIGGHAWRRS